MRAGHSMASAALRGSRQRHHRRLSRPATSRGPRRGLGRRKAAPPRRSRRGRPVGSESGPRSKSTSPASRGACREVTGSARLRARSRRRGGPPAHHLLEVATTSPLAVRIEHVTEPRDRIAVVPARVSDTRRARHGGADSSASVARSGRRTTRPGAARCPAGRRPPAGACAARTARAPGASCRSRRPEHVTRRRATAWRRDRSSSRPTKRVRSRSMFPRGSSPEVRGGAGAMRQQSNSAAAGRPCYPAPS